VRSRIVRIGITGAALILVTACQTLLGFDDERPLVPLVDADATSDAESGRADAWEAGFGDAADMQPEGGASDAAGGGDSDLAIAWNAYLPLFGGSASGGEPGVTPDISGHGYSATYAHGISFTSAGMIIAGAGDLSMPPQRSVPAVDLTGSYSVSAWISMTDTSGFRTFVSADGRHVSSFYLQKRNDSGYFAFAVTASDATAAADAPCIASSGIAPSANLPYHLVATRDAT